MNQSNYKILFSITISHSYFQTKTDASLRLETTEATMNLMTRFKLLIRKTNSGVELFCAKNESIKDIFTTIKEQMGISSLDFDFNPTDCNFYSYTEIPENVGILVYSSDNSFNQKENEKSVLNPTFIEEQDKKRLGRVHIQLIDILESHDSDKHTIFNISFTSRSIKWHYYIINSDKITLNEMSIETSSELKFNDAKQIILENGQNATFFESENLIPLRNHPEHVCKLKVGTETIISSLPTPDLQNLYCDKSNGETLYIAKMYVFV